MGIYASKSIERLRKRIGYQEKKSLGTREQMEQLHWNPGSANLTIDWIWFKDLVGYTYQGQAWCFGCQVVNDALEYGLETTLRLLNCKQLPVNCQDFVTSHSGDKRLNNTPTVGAYVFFHNGKKWCHVGKVTGVYKSYITSIEGNTSGTYDKVVPDGGAIVEKEHRFDTTKMIYWHPDYDAESTERTISEQYDILVGLEGLTVACDLNYRSSPVDGEVLGTFGKGTSIYPTKKVFVYTPSSVSAWYYVPKYGWCSARCLSSGWVYEENVARWWWIKVDYKCDYNKLFVVKGETYYADSTGYIVQGTWVDVDSDWRYFDIEGRMVKSAYVKSATNDTYYWLDENGIWDSSKDTEKPNLKCRILNGGD